MKAVPERDKCSLTRWIWTSTGYGKQKPREESLSIEKRNAKEIAFSFKIQTEPQLWAKGIHFKVENLKNDNWMVCNK